MSVAATGRDKSPICDRHLRKIGLWVEGGQVVRWALRPLVASAPFVETMTTSQAVTLDLDGHAIEIATGYRGVGVFITILGGRRGRVVTVALPTLKADELARLLRLAAAASRSNETRQ